MLRLDRRRAPLGVPARTVAWPVTVFRVRARVQAPVGLDPFQRLILDMAHAGEDDPQRIARLSGLPSQLVKLLMAQLNSQGWLDGMGRLTPAGTLRRLDKPQEKVVIGWMLRDDLTGQPLPWLGSGAPRHGGRPDGVFELPTPAGRAPAPGPWLPMAMIDACRLHHKLQRLSRQDQGDAGPLWESDEGTMAAATAERRARPENIELLDSGDFTSMLVDVWVPIQDTDAELMAGCPFGRKHDGRRYLHRLHQTLGAFELLRELNREARRAQQRLLADRADAQLLEQLQQRVDEVTHGREVPDYLLAVLRDAEWLALRAELGRLQPEPALGRYGVVAENLLLELRPPKGATPDPDAVKAFLDTVPEGLEDATAVQALADRITLLVPEDDEGRGLEVPPFMERAAVSLIGNLRRGHWPGWDRVGIHRQLLPFAAAAIQPDTPESQRVREALERDRDLWRMLTRVIGLRNPASHGRGQAAPSRDKLERDLAASREATHRAIRAIFPEGEQAIQEKE